MSHISIYCLKMRSDLVDCIHIDIERWRNRLQSKVSNLKHIIGFMSKFPCNFFKSVGKKLLRQFEFLYRARFESTSRGDFVIANQWFQPLNHHAIPYLEIARGIRMSKTVCAFFQIRRKLTRNPGHFSTGMGHFLQLPGYDFYVEKIKPLILLENFGKLIKKIIKKFAQWISFAIFVHLKIYITSDI